MSARWSVRVSIANERSALLDILAAASLIVRLLFLSVMKQILTFR
jgi:hypothetical protein